MEELDFDHFGKAVDKQFALMQSYGVLVRVNIEPDALWEKYISSFPPGSNEEFRTRGAYECNCCKSFIKRIGNVVALGPNGIMTIWDIEVPGYYQTVTDAVSELVKGGKIVDYYLTYENHVGTKTTPDKHIKTKKWKHFFLPVPSTYVVGKKDVATRLGELRATKDVCERSLRELSLDALETVMELIEQDSIYRGKEHKEAVKGFLTLKKEYDKLPEEKREAYAWLTAKKVGPSTRFRGTVIGTLVEDLSNGKDLEAAVKSFESKVAPHNYKRTTSLVTADMIKKAQAEINAKGYEETIHRDFAKPTDISPTNLIFTAHVDKNTDVFSEMVSEANSKPKPLAKVEEVSVDKFITDILPLVKSMEVLVENRLAGNFMSVMNAQYPNSPLMFKWDNHFSWSYTGDIADSIKERVKAAGGSVVGDMRTSLAWFNYDDLDIHVFEPDGYEIYFRNRGTRSPSYGLQDVDMNAGSGNSREAVENVVWSDKSRMKKGVYRVVINNWCKRETTNVGFDVQVEVDGTIYNFSYKKAVRDGENVPVCDIMFDGTKFSIVNVHKDVESSSSSREVWGVNTETFVPVTMVMNSPNYWGENAVGNKHLFFILEGCKNDDNTRGFFNEYLKGDLEPHRKAFELLGAKIKAKPTENQVSGLGFSETKRDSVTVRVTGKTNRTFVVKF